MSLPKLITPLYIARVFQRVATCLDSIESFSAGYEFEANLQQDLKYPMLFLETPTLLEYSRYTQKMTIAFSILNRAPEGISGQRIETDIENGVFNIITEEQYRVHEVLGLLQQHFSDNFNWDNISILPLYEAYQDKVYGHRVELVFNSGQGIDYCLNTAGDTCDFENLEPTVTEEASCEIIFNQEVTLAFALDTGLNSNQNPEGTNGVVAVFDYTCEPPPEVSSYSVSWIFEGEVLSIEVVSYYVLSSTQALFIFSTQSGNWNGYPGSQICINNNGVEACFTIQT